MNIVGEKILVEVLPVEEEVNGVLLPIKNRKQNEGIVLLVGNNVKGVKVGNTVRYYPGRGTNIQYKEKKCLFLTAGKIFNDIELVIDV